LQHLFSRLKDYVQAISRHVLIKAITSIHIHSLPWWKALWIAPHLSMDDLDVKSITSRQLS